MENELPPYQNVDLDDLSQTNLTAEEQAEQRLMHALLWHHHEDQATQTAEDEKRYLKVLSAIDKDIGATKPHNPSSNRPSAVVRFFRKPTTQWLGAAASVCLLIIVFSIALLPNKQALAEINNLKLHLANLGDRLYIINVEPLHNAAQQTKHTLTKNSQTYKKSAAIWLNNAKLYMRDQHSYLLSVTTDKGQKLRAITPAGDWKTDQKNSLFEPSKQQNSKLPLSGNAGSMALMDLPQLFTTLEKNYDLQFAENSMPIASQGNKQGETDLSLIIAKKKHSGIKGVKSVYIYYHHDSYLIGKLEFNGVHLQGEQAKYKVNLTLKNTDPLDKDFFTYNYHLADSL